MPYGRTVVALAWAQLSEQVRTGPLAGRGGVAPSRRVYKPLMRALFPKGEHPASFTAGNLDSATTHDFSDAEAASITARLLAADASLRRLGPLLEAVLAELRRRGYRGGDDPPATSTIAAFFEFDGDDGDPASLAALQARICDGLVDRATPVQDARRMFADPQSLSWIEQRLAAHEGVSSAAPAPPSAAAAAQLDGDLRGYLDRVGYHAGIPTLDLPEGAEAWARLVARDAIGVLSATLHHVGLSAHRHPLRATVGGPGDGDADDDGLLKTTPPLDRTLYQRVWSIARSASGRPWADTLPPLHTIVEHEIASLENPLQLATAQARAALTAGLHAYREILADPASVFVDTTGMHPEVAEALAAQRDRMLSTRTRAAQRMAGMVRAFLQSIGDGAAAKGWARLSRTAQDALSQPEPVLLPELWDRLHNAQYRPGFLDDGATVWGLISGRVETQLKTLAERYRTKPEERTFNVGSLQVAAVQAQYDAMDHTGRLRVVDFDTDDAHQFARKVERDERVRETLGELRHQVGWDDYAGFLTALQELRTLVPLDEESARARLGLHSRLVGAWSAASRRIAGGESSELIPSEDGGRHLAAALAASWNDLMEYLDDHVES